MLQKIKKKYLLKKNLFLIKILIVWLALVFSNIGFSSFFTGWDNAHPEFNLYEYFFRTISGAWLENEALGLIPAKPQLSEFFRLPFLFILSFFPVNLSRYLFHFLMLLIGGLGIYFFSKDFWIQEKDGLRKRILAFVAVIFYWLNIYTLQQFYISFELFIVQYAFLPFWFWGVYRFLAYKKKDILLISSLLIGPSGHTPTVFYIGFFSLLFFAFFLSLDLEIKFKKAFLNTAKIFAIVFLLNFYWIFGNIYYSIQNSKAVINSQANLAFNQEVLWSIYEYASLENFLKGTSYLFQWKNYDFKSLDYDYIFGVWIDYFSSFGGFMLVFMNILSLIGVFLIFNLWKKRQKAKAVILLNYFVFLVVVWGGVFFYSFFPKLIYKIPFLREVFRNPFTKTQILVSFFSSLSFLLVVEKILRRREIKIFLAGVIFIITINILAFLPAFRGDFINEKLKTGIPREYFDLYSFLNREYKDSRILELPFYSNVGWVYHNWLSLNRTGIIGYQGIGINFFGLSQSYITPDFARWNKYVDSLYIELQQAVNTNDQKLFENVLKKYNIDLVLVDNTIFDPSRNSSDLFKKYERFLTGFACDIVWKKGFLRLYKCPVEMPRQKGYLIPQVLTAVDNDAVRLRKDPVYENEGDYMFFEEFKDASVYYPFIEVFKISFDEKEFFNIKNKNLGRRYARLIFSEISENANIPVRFSFVDGEIRFLPLEIVIETGRKKIKFDIIPEIRISQKTKSQRLIFETKRLSRLIEEGDRGFFAIFPYDDFLKVYSIASSSPQDWRIEKLLLEKEFKYDSLSSRYLDISGESVSFNTNFEFSKIRLSKNSENCSRPLQGDIKTIVNKDDVVYTAENFAVNCASFDFGNIFSPNTDFFLKITGENLKGRSLKFFLNYDYKKQKEIPSSMVMPQGKYSYYTSVFMADNSYLPLNWETRSFGKKAVNKLYSIDVLSFSFDFISKIKMTGEEELSIKNTSFKIAKKTSLLDFFDLMDVECGGEYCFFSNNQTYDSGWVALSSDLEILPKGRLNSWANIWMISEGEKKIIVFYIPEIISAILLFVVVGYIIFRGSKELYLKKT